MSPIFFRFCFACLGINITFIFVSSLRRRRQLSPLCHSSSQKINLPVLFSFSLVKNPSERADLKSLMVGFVCYTANSHFILVSILADKCLIQQIPQCEIALTLTHFPLRILLKLVSGFLVTVLLQRAKPFTKPFTGRTLHGLLIQMQNISLQNLDINTELSKLSTFSFPFLSFPVLSLLVPCLFFLFCWTFSRFHFGGKSFREIF